MNERAFYPATLTKTLFICARRKSSTEELLGSYPDQTHVIDLQNWDPTGPGMSNTQGWVVLGTHKVTVDVPQLDPTDLEIVELEKMDKEVLAEAHVKSTAIRARINELKALEYKP